MLRGAEKVLDCGHTYCNNCIRSFGYTSGLDSQEYYVPRCMQCLSRPEPRVFRFKPPTAGVRTLSLDGGGIRGIITLAVLCYFGQQLAYLGCPLQDHFDFVVGTSSGGIVAVGFSLMGWTPDECFDKFYALAYETFGKFQNGSLQFIGDKILQFLPILFSIKFPVEGSNYSGKETIFFWRWRLVFCFLSLGTSAYRYQAVRPVLRALATPCETLLPPRNFGRIVVMQRTILLETKLFE